MSTPTVTFNINQNFENQNKKEDIKLYEIKNK